MKINIKTTNLELTPSIQAYLEEKIATLDKFISVGEEGDKLRHPVIEAFVEVGKTTRHHHKGDIFRAEVNLKIGGRILRAEAEEWELHVAIDKVKDELQGELKKFKDRQDTNYKKGARVLKVLKNLSPASWFGKEE